MPSRGAWALLLLVRWRGARSRRGRATVAVDRG